MEQTKPLDRFCKEHFVIFLPWEGQQHVILMGSPTQIRSPNLWMLSKAKQQGKAILRARLVRIHPYRRKTSQSYRAAIAIYQHKGFHPLCLAHREKVREKEGIFVWYCRVHQPYQKSFWNHIALPWPRDVPGKVDATSSPLLTKFPSYTSPPRNLCLENLIYTITDHLQICHSACGPGKYIPDQEGQSARRISWPYSYMTSGEASDSPSDPVLTQRWAQHWPPTCHQLCSS